MGLSNKQYREIFVSRNGLLSAPEFERTVQLGAKIQRPLEQLLIERSLINETQFLQLLQDFFNTPSTGLKANQIDIETLRLVPEDFATQNLVIAFTKDDSSISVAVQDPTDRAMLDSLEQYVMLPVKLHVALRNDLQQALILYKGNVTERIGAAAADYQSDTLDDRLFNNSAIVLCDAIIEAAVVYGASDIHLEPYESEILVRFRIDGQLRSMASLPTSALDSLIARIKILSELKVDQRRLPQDGRFTLNLKGQEINFRVSTVPSLWGEKVVLRVLPKASHSYDLTTVGLQEADRKRVENYLARPHGMILVTGPTGSGKTTTLYSFLQEIGRERIDIVNISTIEDPIEYTVPRVTQIQTQPEIELTFAAGLRALLRQDPDILMVGEIRDEETADFAVRAALVGRLLLSSLHTNDAPSAIPRMLDMGIEPYLLSSVLMLVVAQRLARNLCKYCRQSYHPEKTVLQELNDLHDLKGAMIRLKKMGMVASSTTSDLRFYKANGCERCDNTGYQGRSGIFEVLEMTPPLQAAVSKRLDSNAIRELAVAGGMRTMFEDGLTKLLNGDIDLDELLRAVYS